MARAELRQAVANAAWQAGQSLSIDEALEYARAGQRLANSPVVERLTAREREILMLLARGYRNREIGDHLVISERTAEWHVANVLAKLGLESRAQLGPWLAEQREPVV